MRDKLVVHPSQHCVVLHETAPAFIGAQTLKVILGDVITLNHIDYFSVVVQAKDARACEEYAHLLCELMRDDLQRAHRTLPDYFQPSIHIAADGYGTLRRSGETVTVITIEQSIRGVVLESLRRVVSSGDEMLVQAAQRGQSPDDRSSFDRNAIRTAQLYLSRRRLVGHFLPFAYHRLILFTDFWCVLSHFGLIGFEVALLFRRANARDAAFRVISSRLNIEMSDFAVEMLSGDSLTIKDAQRLGGHGVGKFGMRLRVRWCSRRVCAEVVHLIGAICSIKS